MWSGTNMGLWAIGEFVQERTAGGMSETSKDERKARETLVLWRKRIGCEISQLDLWVQEHYPVLIECISHALAATRRDELELGFKHFSDYEFVRDYFKVRLASLSEKETT